MFDELGSVKTVIVDSEPWFVGKDAAIGLAYTETEKAVRAHIDNKDKNVAFYTVTPIFRPGTCDFFPPFRHDFSLISGRLFLTAQKLCIKNYGIYTICMLYCNKLLRISQYYFYNSLIFYNQCDKIIIGFFCD